MGEQGVESIHAHLMRLEKMYQGIANDVELLKYIVKEQMLESAPQLVTLRPPPKKRSKTRDTVKLPVMFQLSTGTCNNR